MINWSRSTAAENQIACKLPTQLPTQRGIFIVYIEIARFLVETKRR